MVLLKGVLCVLSIAIPILLFEVGLRVVREKMDYLAPERVADSALGFRLVPFSGGHDEWGFRNLAVPESSEVVALGDSNTWGVAARWDESWPSWYSRKTGRSVYNLGMSAYGPVEYFHLLKTRALSLKPERVVVALYFGNDFVDAYRAVSDRREWSDFRTGSMTPSPAQAEPADFHPGAPFVNHQDAKKNSVKRIRNWLRGNSMLFRIIEEGPVGQRVNAWGDQRAGFAGRHCAVKIDAPFATVLQPDHRFAGLNLDDPKVEEGIALSLLFLEKTARLAEENGSEFLVVLIPTKESVLVRKTQEVRTGCEEILQKVLAHEEVIRARVQKFLNDHDIAFVDTLEALRAHALLQPVYLQSGDSHPNGEGYAVIAEKIVAAR
jgi:hypothetical protein